MQVSWSRWWIWLWGLVAIGLLALAFLIPFKWWALAAGVGFGVLEGFGLARRQDAFPPLTQVIRQYVPRWVAFTAIYGLVGSAGGVWIGYAHPARMGFMFALLGWLSSHFDVTFDSDAVQVERAKYDRLLGPVVRAFSSKPPSSRS